MHSYVSLPEGNAKVVVSLMFICFFPGLGLCLAVVHSGNLNITMENGSSGTVDLFFLLKQGDPTINLSRQTFDREYFTNLNSGQLLVTQVLIRLYARRLKRGVYTSRDLCRGS